MYYVYEWFIEDTGEVFYVGKGHLYRYKELRKRNPIFNSTIENHKCNVRITQRFEEDEEAIKAESERIAELKKINQAKANLMIGGVGSPVYIWTDEARKWMSENNPMKKEYVKQKVSATVSRHVMLGDKEYASVEKLRKEFGIAFKQTVYGWIRRGYSTDGTPCYYKGNPPKEISRRVTCSKGIIIDGEYFPSLRSAHEFLGIKDSSPLVKALKGKRPYRGHKCEYANQQPSPAKSDNSNGDGSTTNG